MTKREIIELYLADLNNLVPDSDAKRSRIIDLEDELEDLRIHDVVGRSEQFYCTCSRAKGLDHDEEGAPYCISCQKKVQ